MAVVTLEKNGFIQLTWTNDSTFTWDYASDTPAYAKLGYLCSAITLHAGTANDVQIVYEGKVDGPSPIHWKLSAASDDRIRYFDPPKWIRPFLEYDNSIITDYSLNKLVFTLV